MLSPAGSLQPALPVGQPCDAVIGMQRCAGWGDPEHGRVAGDRAGRRSSWGCVTISVSRPTGEPIAQRVPGRFHQSGVASGVGSGGGV